MKNGLPETLQEAIRHFSDKKVCHDFMVSIRWPEGVFCPFCGSAEHSFISTRFTWQCKGCKKQFSSKVGTVFEDSPITLDKWFVALWLLANCKNGVSSYEIARDLGVTQKTGWFMLHRLRLAMKARSFDKKLCGVVETDETYIGGQLKNMHKSKRTKKGYSPKGHSPFSCKTLVQAVLERDGDVRAQVLTDLDADIRRAFIRMHVEKGAELMSDMGASRFTEFIHQYINHEHEYVRGNVHTQGIENFWSLLKRGLHGTYVSVEPFHLSAYVDEQAFRFNHRKTTDADRFVKTLSQIAGRRLTYAQLTRQPNNN
jgi:transposase-like protein